MPPPPSQTESKTRPDYNAKKPRQELLPALGRGHPPNQARAFGEDATCASTYTLVARETGNDKPRSSEGLSIPRKPSFQRNKGDRVFTEEDEISLRRAMLGMLGAGLEHCDGISVPEGLESGGNLSP